MRANLTRRKLLQRAAGAVALGSAATARLGLKRTSLAYKMQKFGISRSRQ